MANNNQKLQSGLNPEIRMAFMKSFVSFVLLSLFSFSSLALSNESQQQFVERVKKTLSENYGIVLETEIYHDLSDSWDGVKNTKWVSLEPNISGKDTCYFNYKRVLLENNKTIRSHKYFENEEACKYLNGQRGLTNKYAWKWLMPAQVSLRIEPWFTSGDKLSCMVYAYRSFDNSGRKDHEYLYYAIDSKHCSELEKSNRN